MKKQLQINTAKVILKEEELDQEINVNKNGNNEDDIGEVKTNPLKLTQLKKTGSASFNSKKWANEAMNSFLSKKIKEIIQPEDSNILKKKIYKNYKASKKLYDEIKD
ncbi:hypothetical protein C1645_836174 [Glomus cerebriforme]|uniref:Uncharacterized protein n=1 Tax=Glomus cerebriforme TaxID=658196 RepID=A0A397SB37_9GLOM|nr:hypothetical protein C1645_836174 [Glomus cerebriforme]